MSKERWDKNWQLISELVGVEREGRYGMSRARMESIRRVFNMSPLHIEK